MKRLLLSILLTVSLFCDATAAGLFNKGNSVSFDYTTWSDTTSLSKETEDGLSLFYPVTEAGKAVISGKIKIPAQDTDNIFFSALNYAVNHIDIEEDHESIGELNELDKSFRLRLYSKQGSNNTETIFSRLVLIKVENEYLSFTITEIDVKYREKGILPRTLPFEKLNPATNIRHRELVELFVLINSNYFHDITHAIGDSNAMRVTHWQEIDRKEVVNGMNELEVKLILGLPVTYRVNGERLRWVYPNNLVILFENGKVYRVID